MRKGFKPYNKRKPFKRKNGGAKFMLGGETKNSKFSFPESQNSKASEAIANLISMILSQKKKQSIIRIKNK